MNNKHSIVKAAGKMSVATFVSRILGYVKDMLLAYYFGATGVTDAFFASFRIPNLLRELFAEGSMSSAFVPVLTEYRLKHGESEARRLVRITFTFICLFVGIICLIGILVSPGIVAVVAPGFLSKFPEKFPLTVTLTRIMMPFLLFISLSSFVMGVLNTRRVFFIPAIAPAMLNVTIIFTVIFMASFFREPIIAVSIGVLLGGAVQFIFQLPFFYREKYRLGYDVSFRHPGLKKMGVLLIPATFALAINQVYIIISTIIASYLPNGSITYLYYSMRLIQFPIGIFAVAMGMAVLPTLSEHAVKGEIEKLREDFSFALRMLFFISFPAMVGLIVLREPIVNLLFQRGTWDYDSTRATADALLFYSFGIVSTGGIKVVTPAFYSMRDTKTPVKVAGFGVIVNITLSIFLMRTMMHSGIALAYSVSTTLNLFLLSFFLRKKLQRLDARRIVFSSFKILTASCIMGLIGSLLLQDDMWQKSGDTFIKSMWLSMTILGCFIIYLIMSAIMKSEEMTYLYEAIRRKFLRKV